MVYAEKGKEQESFIAFIELSLIPHLTLPTIRLV